MKHAVTVIYAEGGMTLAFWNADMLQLDLDIREQPPEAMLFSMPLSVLSALSLSQTLLAALEQVFIKAITTLGEEQQAEKGNIEKLLGDMKIDLP